MHTTSTDKDILKDMNSPGPTIQIQMRALTDSREDLKKERVNYENTEFTSPKGELQVLNRLHQTERTHLQILENLLLSLCAAVLNKQPTPAELQAEASKGPGQGPITNVHRGVQNNDPLEAWEIRSWLTEILPTLAKIQVATDRGPGPLERNPLTPAEMHETQHHQFQNNKMQEILMQTQETHRLLETVLQAIITEASSDENHAP